MSDFLLVHAFRGVTGNDLRQFLDPAGIRMEHPPIHAPTWSATTFGNGEGAAALASGHGQLAGAGAAALDNRACLLASLPREAAASSDVQITLMHLAAGPRQAVRDILGAFALAFVDSSGHELTMARDALGIAPLYYRFVGDLLAVSTNDIALAVGCAVDREFVAEFLVNGSNPESRTIHDGVRSLPPGTLAVRRQNTLHMHEFWSPREFACGERHAAPTATEEFRTLFAAAVRASVGDSPHTCAELSGGIDSSSVVCMAEVLARRGELRHRLDHTVTMVEELGWGDERKYSDAVVRQYGLSNIKLKSGWPFFDDGEPPPSLMTLSPGYAQYAAQRQVARTIQQLGCTRLLSGFGADHYLTADFVFVADLIATGRLSVATHILLEQAVVIRRSFWRGLRGFGIFPLLPGYVRKRSAAVGRSVPRWIRSQFVAEYDLLARTPLVRRYSAPWGRKAGTAITYDLRALLNQLHPSQVFGLPAMRYPFLYRPLVEYALRLPPTVRAAPHCSKLIVRRALGNDLPDIVRRRTGKGSTGTRAMWALSHERTVVDKLVTTPLLRELGCVSATRLRQEVERARGGTTRDLPGLIQALSLELWLRVRQDRWAPTEGAPAACVEVLRGDIALT